MDKEQLFETKLGIDYLGLSYVKGIPYHLVHFL